MTPIYDIIAVDYGHGGVIDDVYQTEGSKEYTFTDEDPPKRVLEGVLNRRTACKLIQMLLGAGFKVYDVVAGSFVETFPVTWKDLHQEDVPLQVRTDRVNKLRSFCLLSVHTNAIGNNIQGKSQNARGISVFTSKGQTRADVIATSIYQGLEKSLKMVSDPDFRLTIRKGNWEDGDQDHEANFHILRETINGPAVLVEGGFFTSREDVRVLESLEGSLSLARGYFLGLREHLRQNSVDPAT